MSLPIIRFYIAAINKCECPTLSNLYEKNKISVREYYERFGKDGFLSERMAENDIDAKAMRLAKDELSRYDADFETRRVCAFNNEDYIEKKEIIERDPCFVRWM